MERGRGESIMSVRNSDIYAASCKIQFFILCCIYTTQINILNIFIYFFICPSSAQWPEKNILR
jgi:hypothetical protein